MCAEIDVAFAWLISRTFSANEQYFSLTINQSTVLLVMSYQPNEQGVYHRSTRIMHAKFLQDAAANETHPPPTQTIGTHT